MKTILVVAGTRPEIIKTAPIVIESKKNGAIKTIYCLTGQHDIMAQEVLSVFDIIPDENLQIMQPNQTINYIAGEVFKKLPSVIDKYKPDFVLVQGDTTTSAMSAICSFNSKIPVVHIEAGLRTFNMYAPYPEECNRRLISAVSKYNFCPTELAKINLLREGVDESSIFITGNTVIDALRIVKDKNNLDDYKKISSRINKPFILITAHRRESFGKGFQNICEGIKKLAEKYRDFQFIYPVHLNPNVKEPVNQMLSDIKNVVLIHPLPYLDMLILLKNCELVITDSGGIQEEAPSFGKYCIVLREVTERMESVKMGLAELVGTDVKKITSAVENWINRKRDKTINQNPYGDGFASQKILEVLKK